MRKYNVLILTDHTYHTKENSLYPLAKAMLRHELSNSVDVGSKGFVENAPFFQGNENAEIFVTKVDQNFTFSEKGHLLSDNLRSKKPYDYDLIWLRMPPPIERDLLEFFERIFNDQFVLNNPKAIFTTGSKEFLLKFPELCPPIKICNRKEDIISFKNQFPIVLKPFRDYGGRGIVKIDGNDVWIGGEEVSFDKFIVDLPRQDLQYLGVKYLKNVSEGDKRIVVVNGRIIGASLRLPVNGSWICNVAMGGSSMTAEADEDERKIIRTIDPVLSKMGVLIYGVDTLVGDDGKRLLSEINTTSTGGLHRIQELSILDEAIDSIWQHFLKRRT